MSEIIAASSSPSLGSPNYPDNYDNNQNCSWTIQADPGRVVELYIRFFQTEADYDYLTVSLIMIFPLCSSKQYMCILWIIYENILPLYSRAMFNSRWVQFLTPFCYQINDTASQEMLFYESGDVSAQTVPTNANQVLIHFSSDGSNTAGGFIIYVYQVRGKNMKTGLKILH